MKSLIRNRILLRASIDERRPAILESGLRKRPKVSEEESYSQDSLTNQLNQLIDEGDQRLLSSKTLFSALNGDFKKEEAFD
jgi:hypothetical protein